MIFEHRFRVRAPLESVARFHRIAASMAAITPPPIVVRLHESPALLHDGARMRFTLWIGPIPVRWLAEMEAMSESGFTDRQIEGPFAAWTHEHRFRPIAPNETEVLDRIEVTLHPYLPWRLIGWAIWIGLPLTFAYRAWRTRRLLERASSGEAAN